jgi:hypothetical protein
MEFRKVKLENGKRENREAEAAATRHSVKGQYVRGVKRRAFVEWLFGTVGFKWAEGKGLREGWDSKELWKSVEN